MEFADRCLKATAIKKLDLHEIAVGFSQRSKCPKKTSGGFSPILAAASSG